MSHPGSADEVFAALDACISSGLGRSHVVGATFAFDSGAGTCSLTLECPLDAARSAEVARTFAAPTPAVLIETKWGAWSWSGTALANTPTHFDAEGVRFTVGAANVDSNALFGHLFEACLTAFRVHLRSEYRSHGKPVAANIIVLEGLSPIRVRPTMYLGSVANPHVVAQMMLEYAVHGWLSRGTTRIDVRLLDNTLGIRDNGKPYLLEPGERQLPAQRVFGSLMTNSNRGNFEEPHSTELGVANAVCSRFDIETSLGADAWCLRYAKGKELGPLAARPTWPHDGTAFTLVPDLNIFDGPLELTAVRTEVERLAELCPGLTITFNCEAFCAPSLVVAAARAAGAQRPLGDQWLECTVNTAELRLRVAFGFAADRGTTFCSWANLAPAGGSHVRGVLDAIADAVALPTTLATTTDLIGCIALDVRTPRYTWSDERRPEVDMPEVTNAIRRALAEPLAVYLDQIALGRETLRARWLEKTS